MNNAKQQSSRVTAIFEEAALAFNLPRGATLEELAEELGALGEIYGGLPLYVDVRLPAGTPSPLQVPRTRGVLARAAALPTAFRHDWGGADGCCGRHADGAHYAAVLPAAGRPSPGAAPVGGAMTAISSGTAERAKAERLRSLAQRCRDLSEQTAIPDVSRELLSIADALDSEAELVAER